MSEKTVVVPVEPTYDMLRAAGAVSIDVEGEDEGGQFCFTATLDPHDVRQIWEAMIKAAPKP